MTKDSRGYYYRSKRINGKVVKQYLGKSELINLMALFVKTIDLTNLLYKQQLQVQKLEEIKLEAIMDEMNTKGQQLIQMAMIAAGYHQHKRQWRKRRETHRT